MKLNILQVFSLLLLLGATSCTSTRDMPYFQTHGDPKEFETRSPYADKSVVRFQPDDVISIAISVVGEQRIVSDYVLSSTMTSSDAEGGDNTGQTGGQNYLVSKSGEINFPTLGWIKVAGYTPEELQEYIKGLIRDRMRVEPIVNVRLMNFRIWVLGEVGGPGQKIINKDRIDLFEAITLAGDLTINGRRDRVFIRRQLPDGSFRYVKLDISKADVTTSPYFYLRQNDLIYVQPNKQKALQSDYQMYGMIVGVFSFLVSILTLIRVR